MVLFRILWCMSTMALVVIGWLFVTALIDDSVTCRNIKGWLFILTAAVSILWISILLRKQGYHKAALAAILMLVIPVIVYGLFISMYGNSN